MVAFFFVKLGTAELPASDEFEFPFQLVKHKCKDKKLNIEEKPEYETKTSRFVQTAHSRKANGLAQLSMLTLTLPRKFVRTGPANSEGVCSEASLFSNYRVEQVMWPHFA